MCKSSNFLIVTLLAVFADLARSDSTSGSGVRQCFSSNFSSVRFDEIQLNPFLVCENSPFFVRLKSVALQGTNSLNMFRLDRSAHSDHSSFKYRFSHVKLDGFYEANATLSQLFPVYGSGNILIKLDLIEIETILEPSSNGNYQFRVKDVQFSNPFVTIEDNNVNSRAQLLRGDENFRKSLGKVAIWQSIKLLEKRRDFKLISDCLISDLLSNSTIRKELNKPHKLNSPIVSRNLNRHRREIMSHAKDKIFPIASEEKSEKYWFTSAEKAINKGVDHRVNAKPAKNVILFLGDGMGISTLTAARILKGQVNGKSDAPFLKFEEFPNSALIKTFNLDKHVPDSAATASAFLTGVKANYQTIGVNGEINSSEKDCDKINKNAADSIMTWAQKANKATGIITNMRITHATPAAGYAHVAHRWWESDTDVRNATVVGTCVDIARQLIESEPGSELRVIYGGGRKNMVSPSVDDPYSHLKGRRSDGRNLIEDWIRLKKEKKTNSVYINSTRGLRSLDYKKTDYVLGLFSYDHLPYDVKRDKSDNGQPSLMEMTESAIKLVDKYDNGYVLLIEGGLIDWAHHRNRAATSLLEVLEFEKAIEKALSMVSLDDTMIIVTADHSHTFTISGYAPRNQSIFGLSEELEQVDGVEKPFTTLMYATGPGNIQPRPDPRTLSLYDTDYQSYSAINLVDSTHGGEDVALYSAGPNSHLFHGLQDQTIIAHIIAYSSCIGRFISSQRCSARNHSVAIGPSLFLLVSAQTVFLYFCKKILKF